jgi:hypothetical protein
VLLRDLETFRSRGEWAAVEQVARALLEHDPFNETATLCLAEALARIGSKTNALGLLRAFELEVGKSSESLTLPPRILARRIADASRLEVGPVETPFFGRDEELQRLGAFWGRAKSGHFTPILALGAESIGKSRLASEFAASVRIDGHRGIIHSRRSPLDIQRPLSLFADIVKELFALRGGAGCSPHTLSFLSRLTRTDQLDTTAGAEQLDFAYSNAAVRRAVTDLFDSVLSEQPLLLILDDYEHLDHASLELLRDLRASLVSRPCLLLLIGRTLGSADMVGAAKIRLAPLSHADSKDLATAIVTTMGMGSSPTVIDRAVGLAAGNPGHLRLLLLDKDPSRENSPVPNALIAAIDSRLGTLSPKALHLLQACAVIGSGFTMDAARKLTGLRGYSLVNSLQELEDAALTVFRENGVHCAGSLIAERVTATTTPAIAALLHERAARILERRIGRSKASQATAWTIAEHWRQAGVRSASLRWQLRCWRQLLSIGHPRAAVDGIRATLAIADSLEERATLLSALADALRGVGDFAALRQVLSERIALSGDVEDPIEVRRALAFDLREANEILSGDRQRSPADLERHASDSDLDITRRLRAVRLLLIAADVCFDLEAAKRGYSISKNIAPSTPPDELLSLQAALIYHSSYGQREDAFACAARLLELADGTERSWGRLSAMKVYVIAFRGVAAEPRVNEVLERMFAECSDHGVHRTAIGIAGLLASFWFDDGDIEASKHWGAIARDLLMRPDKSEMTIEYTTSQIDLALYAGDVATAEGLLRAFLTHAPSAPRPRLYRELLVYRVRVDQFAGRGTAESDLAELQRIHELAKSFGRHDDHVEVLWAALRERGDFGNASALLSDYLKESRRELRRCHYWLRTRTACDPAWLDSSVKHFA